jgi:hypothetical protein
MSDRDLRSGRQPAPASDAWDAKRLHRAPQTIGANDACDRDRSPLPRITRKPDATFDRDLARSGQQFAPASDANDACERDRQRAVRASDDRRGRLRLRLRLRSWGVRA